MTPNRSISQLGHALDLVQRYASDLKLGIHNLLLHRLRTLLTMLGMIFGVAAVLSMLSIGAGARQRVMAFIEQMGVRNVIVEAKESSDWQAHQKIRKVSPGLTFRDYRVVRDLSPAIHAGTPRKRFVPTKILPKPSQELPLVYGVENSYLDIAGLRMIQGRFFDPAEQETAAPVCVLGAGAKLAIFGGTNPIGQYVKVDEQWFRVVGTVDSLIGTNQDVAGVPTQDLNNVIYVPLHSAIFRLENTYSGMHDEIDGIYLNVQSEDAVVHVAEVVRAILNSSHHSAGDFTLIVPAELLAQQKQTERLFNAVMVAIASISLLVGGIGIMNIMLATVLERTREIGVRRAVGARQGDIIRQFVTEATMISFVGGMFGIIFGLAMSRTIAWLAGWSTIVTPTSIVLSFLVSISVGLVFGIYPAVKAAKLDPVDAIRYE